MSQPRSRSPFYMRNANMHGRRGERCFGEPYRSDGWRGPEDVIRQEEDWEDSHSKKVEQVDHWAVFIEAIGRAGKQNSSSTSGYHTPGESQSLKRSSQSPRNLHRQKMGSSGASHNGAKTYEKVQSPGWSKNEHYLRDSSSRQLQGKRHDRQEAEYLNTERDDGYPNKSFYTERSQKSNYEHPPQPKRLRELDHHGDHRLTHRNSPCAPVIGDHDHGWSHHDEWNKNLNPSRTHDQFGDSNPVRSRELSTDQRPPNGRNPPGGCNPGMNQGHLRKMNPLGSRDRGMNQGQSRSRDPPRSYGPDMNQRHSRTRDPSRGKDPSMNQEHPKNLDFPRSNNAVASYQHSRKWDPPNSNTFQKDRNFPRPSRERDPVKHWREFDHHSGMSHETQSGLSYPDIGEETSLQNSLMEREMPVQDRSQHSNRTRMNLHPRQSHRNSNLDLNSDVDLQMNDNRSSMFAQQWQKKMQTGFYDGNMQKQSVPQHKEPKSNSARGDFRGLESLMIKVDTSRPVEQSSYLGCSSERQLSVDLVNVGRQRLDFLPMLEHSGTYKETAVHSGTFAQEIITLVHHVKENYFQGQGMTLNDRFSNRQEYSLPDEEILQHPPLEDVGPIINRPFMSTSQTEIFCNIGPLQGRAQTPAPGDLRFDLERKRLQKLEGVKITIAGNSQKLFQMQENEMACGNTEHPYREGGYNRWSEDIVQQTGQWGHPIQKGPAPNFNSRFNNHHFGSNTRPRGKNFKSVRGARC